MGETPRIAKKPEQLGIQPFIIRGFANAARGNSPYGLYLRVIRVVRGPIRRVCQGLADNDATVSVFRSLASGKPLRLGAKNARIGFIFHLPYNPLC
jgi:hypothetical protein